MSPSQAFFRTAGLRLVTVVLREQYRRQRSDKANNQHERLHGASFPSGLLRAAFILRRLGLPKPILVKIGAASDRASQVAAGVVAAQSVRRIVIAAY